MLRFKDLMERVNETRSFYLEEEVEELDEANENFDSNSKAHQAAKKAVKGWRGMSKATYHSDGSATINTKDKTKNRYGKHGHYSGLETTPSHAAVDQHLKYAGGMHNHSKDEYDNHHQKIDGLHWKVKGKATSYGRTHEIHIHEEVDGLHEISAMKAIRTSVKREVSGVNKSMETGDSDDAGQKKIDKNKERIHKKYGYRAANIAHKAAGKKLDYDDGPYQPRKRKYMEEVDLDESRMKDLAMDMESLSHADFKKKHKRSKQEMQDALKSEGVTLDELSVDTLRSYRAKAKDDAYDAADVDDDRRLRKRSMGSWDAGKKILKKGAPLRKEEIEQTDEELKGNQHKIDANKNGKVDGHDFKILRNAKKARYQ